MTSLQAAAHAVEVCAALSAVALARRRPAHRPAALALALLAVIGLVDAATSAGLDSLPLPVGGAARVLVYLDGACNLATSATIVGLCVVAAIPPERRRRAVSIVVAAWLLAAIVLGVLYPSPLVRGVGLQRVYFAADLTGLFVSTGAIVARTRVEQSPTGVDAVALGLVVLDAAILLAPFSPWRAALFGASYLGPQLVIVVFFAVVTAAQVRGWTLLSGSV